MNLFPTESQVDLEVVLTAVTIAIMASNPGSDPQRFSAILLAASLPEAGLSESAAAMLQRLAASTSEWATQRDQTAFGHYPAYH
jgi:hypothetical protein